jgi:allantoicase
LIKEDQPCAADTEHVFEGGEFIVHPELGEKAWTHVKMTIIPDGGVKRLRVFGRRA